MEAGAVINPSSMTTVQDHQRQVRSVTSQLYRSRPMINGGMTDKNISDKHITEVITQREFSKANHCYRTIENKVQRENNNNSNHLINNKLATIEKKMVKFKRFYGKTLHYHKSKERYVRNAFEEVKRGVKDNLPLNSLPNNPQRGVTDKKEIKSIKDHLDNTITHKNTKSSSFQFGQKNFEHEINYKSTKIYAMEEEKTNVMNSTNSKRDMDVELTSVKEQHAIKKQNSEYTMEAFPKSIRNTQNNSQLNLDNRLEPLSTTTNFMPDLRYRESCTPENNYKKYTGNRDYVNSEHDFYSRKKGHQKSEFKKLLDQEKTFSIEHKSIRDSRLQYSKAGIDKELEHFIKHPNQKTMIGNLTNNVSKGHMYSESRTNLNTGEHKENNISDVKLQYSEAELDLELEYLMKHSRHETNPGKCSNNELNGFSNLNCMSNGREPNEIPLPNMFGNKGHTSEIHPYLRYRDSTEQETQGLSNTHPQINKNVPKSSVDEPLTNMFGYAGNNDNKSKAENIPDDMLKILHTLKYELETLIKYSHWKQPNPFNENYGSGYKPVNDNTDENPNIDKDELEREFQFLVKNTNVNGKPVNYTSFTGDGRNPFSIGCDSPDWSTKNEHPPSPADDIKHVSSILNDMADQGFSGFNSQNGSIISNIVSDIRHRKTEVEGMPKDEESAENWTQWETKKIELLEYYKELHGKVIELIDKMNCREKGDKQ